MEEPVLLTVDQLQEYIPASRSILYRVVNEEGFPRVRIGRKLFIHRGKLLEWLKEKSLEDNTTPHPHKPYKPYSRKRAGGEYK